MALSKKQLKFLIRWVLPSGINVLAFALIFLKGLIPRVAEIANQPTQDITKALLITLVGALAAGLAYSIYRPSLRKLGATGDVLTGVICMTFYFYLIMEALHRVDGQEYMWNKPGGMYMFLIAIVAGAIIGWGSFFTKLENNLLSYFKSKLQD